jgi:hypothetical protein
VNIRLRALWILVSMTLAASAFAGGGSAPVELYQAKPVVTGTKEKNRLIGFALALEDVLVKVSGNPRLIGDPRVAELAKGAASMVSEFSYRDRMSGTQIHDEQGSYDRPHDLTVIFDPQKIDQALVSLGSEPWVAPRPTITLLLGVRQGDRSFMLSSDAERDVDMRDSLKKASVKIGIPVTLPSAAALAAAGVTDAMLSSTDASTLDRIALEAGGNPALVGSLVWSDADFGWVADWKIRLAGRDYAWQIRGVSFDDAFRNAIRGAAQVLSGNGNPD